MAKGAHEIRNFMKQDVASFADFEDVQKRLDEFYMSRIGIRMVRRFRIVKSSIRIELCRTPAAYWSVPGLARDPVIAEYDRPH